MIENLGHGFHVVLIRSTNLELRLLCHGGNSKYCSGILGKARKCSLSTFIQVWLYSCHRCSFVLFPREFWGCAAMDPRLKSYIVRACPKVG